MISKSKVIKTNKNLARKLFVRFLAYMSLVFLADWAVQSFSSYQKEESARDIAIRYTIDNLTPVLETSLWNYEFKDVVNLSDAFLRNSYVTGVIIRDDKGALVAESGNTKRIRNYTDISEGVSTTSIKEGVLYSYELWHKAQTRVRIGEVLLASDNRVMIEQISTLAAINGLAQVMLLVICASLFYFTQKIVISEPVRELTDAIKNIKGGRMETHEFHDRLLYRDDELGELFRSFKSMQINLAERDRQVTDYQRTLENKVEERTNALKSTNKELEDSVAKLKNAQKDLVESEKLASLGSLVSGVAHEVNTPLGVSITAVTHLNAEVDNVATNLEKGALKKSALEEFMHEARESTKILLDNLMRAAQLVKSFKQVAVDQSSEEKRSINLATYIEEVLRSLQPKIKKTKVELDYEYQDEFIIETYPGALAQMITNMVMNSLIHGFKDGNESGLIHIELNLKGDWIELVFHDNGRGMEKSTVRQVFEPFFTTRRGDGGSGLGMNIVYNLVVQKLGGKIDCSSELGKGTTFRVDIPYTQKA